MNCGLLSIIPRRIWLLKCSIEVRFKHFREILLHDFAVGLLMMVCFPKQSSRSLSNFLPDLINDVFKITYNSRSNCFPTWYMSLLVDHICPRRHLSPSSITVNFGWYILLSILFDLFLKQHLPCREGGVSLILQAKSAGT